MLLEVDADGSETFQVDVLDVDRRRLQDHLKLGMLVEAIRIFSVTTVGGPTTGLNISDAISMRAEHAQKSLRVHGARADFHVASRRSMWCSIHASPASRNSLAPGCMDFWYSMRSNRSPAKRSARLRASLCSGFIPARRHVSQKRPDWCAS